MGEWKTTIVGEIAEIEMGQSPNGETCNIQGIGKPLLNGPTEFGLNSPKEVQYTTNSKRECKPLDILFCVRGSTTGRMNWADKEYSIGRGLAAIRHKNGAEFRYFLRGLIEFNLNLLLSSATGSTFPNVTKMQIESIEIKLPSLQEQRAIASILSSLDDKIDLLHRQNQTLEKMAETLFRQWFVEEAKEDWEEIRLGSIVDIISGVSYKSDDLNFSKTALVTLKSFDRKGGFRMDGFKEYTGKYKKQHILKEGDIVVAHTDITQEAELIGNPVLVITNPKYDTLVFSMDLVKVVSTDEKYSNEFLYLLMKSVDFKVHCLGYSNGSTVLHLSKKAIPEYEMKLPSKEMIYEFSTKVKPLIQKQFKNQSQIRSLTALRDALLPKLMSGEVRVKM